MATSKLIVVLAAFLGLRELVSASNVCGSAPYSDFLVLSSYGIAEAYCSKYYPLPTSTVTVTGKRRRDGLAPRAATTTTTTKLTTSKSTTTVATNLGSKWSSCTRSGASFVSTVCSCIETTPITTITKTKTTTTTTTKSSTTTTTKPTTTTTTTTTKPPTTTTTTTITPATTTTTTTTTLTTSTTTTTTTTTTSTTTTTPTTTTTTTTTTPTTTPPVTTTTTTTTTTTVAGPPAPSCSYIGCYSDSVNDPALSGDSTNSALMSVEYCSDYCAGYIYFGVEDGSECICGMIINMDETTGQQEPDSDCNISCEGNPDEDCGGLNRIGIYQCD